MFVEKGKFADIEPPAFLDHGNPDEWYSKRISDNLYTISFPDVMGVANEMTDSGRIPRLGWRPQELDRRNMQGARM